MLQLSYLYFAVILNQKSRLDHPFEGQIGVERHDLRTIALGRGLKFTRDLIAACACIDWARERFDPQKTA